MSVKRIVDILTLLIIRKRAGKFCNYQLFFVLLYFAERKITITKVTIHEELFLKERKADIKGERDFLAHYIRYHIKNKMIFTYIIIISWIYEQIKNFLKKIRDIYGQSRCLSFGLGSTKQIVQLCFVEVLSIGSIKYL